jgi:hypothetical protein
MLQHNGREFLNISELSQYLPEKPAIPTIYFWTRHNKIPFKKFGVKLYFDKQEVDDWNDNGRPASEKV